MMRTASPITLGLGRLRLSDDAASNTERARKKKLVMIVAALIIPAILIVSVSVGILRNNQRKTRSNPDVNGDADGEDTAGWKPTSNSSAAIMHAACARTMYPRVCMSTLLTYPDLDKLKEPKDLSYITLKKTIERVQLSYQDMAVKSATPGSIMDKQERVSYEDCVELLQETIYHLNASLASIRGMSRNKSQSMNPSAMMFYIADINTWLSAALTNQDTCMDGFQQLSIAAVGHVRSNNTNEIKEESKKLSELISNSLAMFQNLFGNINSDSNYGFHGAKKSNFTVLQSHIQNPRSILEKTDQINNVGLDKIFFYNYWFIDKEEMQNFPMWISAGDRLLLQLPPSYLKPDAIVAKDGGEKYTSIAEAVKDAPSNIRDKKYIIYVKAGVYNENVRISKKKINLMFVGDGKGKTVVVSSRNVKDGSTSFSSATFATSGAGFIARDMTFMNAAGPENHQAVALRVGADLSVIYRCSIVGYQDTLYVHSLRQFYRECDIFGTVDFIFGNAAVVLQDCNIYVRKPMDNQRNTITAQGRKDPNQNTGIIIQNCTITAANDLIPFRAAYSTYLGRPWKLYSRTVYMHTFLDDLVDPAGWLEWSGAFALKSLYYGEYMNVGPGAKTNRRVKWPGYRVIKTEEEANQFTPVLFLSASGS